MGEATQFTMFLNRATHPVNLRISSYSLMMRIYHDNLKVLVGGVLANPVRIEHSKTLHPPSNALFSNGLEVAHRLLLFNSTRSLGFTVGASLGVGAFATSTTHSDAEDNESLLVLVAKTTCLVGSGGPGDAVNLGKLAVLPATNSQEVTHDIALFLAI